MNADSLPRFFDDCLIRDRHALRRMAQALARDPEAADLRARFEQRLARSRALFAQRAEALPQPRFPEELPVVERLEEIREVNRPGFPGDSIS
ncbi:hypothetical protein [endosymbiont of unidentified scaly snail isolate Monju]|uniref:hypothetical protein n=1 Tax=endosymbiont of unidentified scaly snail isolate Monju TaxID=1248727 RepID=UPI0005B91822|nr:hypothetical protein [endosymbiont of unidentified scaly snail isolate Monju]